MAGNGGKRQVRQGKSRADAPTRMRTLRYKEFEARAEMPRFLCLMEGYALNGLEAFNASYSSIDYMDNSVYVKQFFSFIDFGWVLFIKTNQSCRLC